MNLGIEPGALVQLKASCVMSHIHTWDAERGFKYFASIYALGSVFIVLARCFCRHSHVSVDMTSLWLLSVDGKIYGHTYITHQENREFTVLTP